MTSLSPSLTLMALVQPLTPSTLKTHLAQPSSPLSVFVFFSPAWATRVTASTIARHTSILNAAFIVEPPLVRVVPRERPVACPPRLVCSPGHEYSPTGVPRQWSSSTHPRSPAH